MALSIGQVNDAARNVGVTLSPQDAQNYANDNSYDGSTGQTALMQKLSPGGYQNYQQTQATQNYQNAVNTAVGGLQTQKTNLADQYGSLLNTVNTQYQPLINQTTETANKELSQRGLTPDSTLYQQQVQGAVAPVYGQEAGNAQQIGLGSINDMNTLAQAIASMQAGGAGTASQLPLQYGSLSLSQQQLPAQLALGSAQAANQSAQARYITVPNVGVVDLTTGQFVGGGVGASTQAQTGVSGLFKYVP